MALTDKLTNIADAVRAKTGKTDLLTLDSMVEEINGIETGGGEELPEGALHYSGNLSSIFANGHNVWVIDLYGDKITTSDINLISNGFFGCTKLKRIPFELNFKKDIIVSISYLFQNCYELESIPKMNGCKIESYGYVFSNCKAIREFPEDFADWFDWSYVDAATGEYSCNHCGVFDGCLSLRKLPMEFMKHYNKGCGYSGVWYQYLRNLYALDEMVDMPIGYTRDFTTNAFSSFASNCYRLKRLTFETDNGMPFVKRWKNQTINLESYIGYSYTPDSIQEYSKYHGITKEKLVSADASYQALKNDADWFTAKLGYSRYNHDSAVETINTLPDTSAYLAANGGTNTIVFKKGSGSLTDGGAINTLTNAEIAVAAAKGWTVSFK